MFHQVQFAKQVIAFLYNPSHLHKEPRPQASRPERNVRGDVANAERQSDRSEHDGTRSCVVLDKGCFQSAPFHFQVDLRVGHDWYT